MVHIFSCFGRDFVLDTESGTLLEVDAAARRAIEKRLSPSENSSGDFFRLGKNNPCLESDCNAGKSSPADCKSACGSACGFDENRCNSTAAVAQNGCKTSANSALTGAGDNACGNADTEAEREIQSLIGRGLLFTPDAEKVPSIYTNTVKALCLNISHNCDLRCTYCFADGGSYSTARKNMSLEVARAAIDFLIEKSKERKNLEVDFFGGEPLLNMDVVKKTVEYARALEKKHNKNFRFTITTNGLGITEELVDYFNKEMHNVVVSIDGREYVHNEVRKDVNGQGSFARALEGARLVKQKRGDRFYYIRGTFTAKNKDFAADALALNDYGFDQISLEPVVLPATHPLALTEADLPLLKEQYESLGAEYIKRRKGDKWFNFFHFMLDTEGGPCLKKRITGCGAGTEYLAVGPDGEIFPCHRFDGNCLYKIGNVLDKTFDDTLPKKFAASNVYTKKDCADCFARYYCSGGCAANSIEYGGGIDNCYRISCELMKKRTEVALAIVALEKGGQAF